MRSPIRVTFEKHRAGTIKNHFRGHKKSAQNGGTSETRVMRGGKDLYILLDLIGPAPLYLDPPSLAECVG